MSGQFKLLSERRFLPLFATQFLGAFNDNVLKNALVILIAFQGARLTSADPKLMVNACAGIFILPFFLFSATAGQLADKYEKSQLIRFVKVLEIAIMLIAGSGFLLPSLPLLLTGLFLMGIHSTLFGPLKYSILPQHLHEDEMIGGNGLIESGTFLAILLGTILGGSLIGLGDAGPGYAAGACLSIAVLGYLASRSIPLAPAPEPGLRVNWNPLTETWRSLRFAKQNRAVFLSILGISWFWFYGAMFLSQFPSYARDNLGGSESVVTLLLAIFSIGIGLGSLLCEKLSHKHVEPGIVPLGSIGLSLFALDLWYASPAGGANNHLSVGQFLAQPGSLRILADLVLIGVFGGFYCVPLYTLMQTRSEASHRSRVIAANNIVNALFMVVAALLAMALLAAGCSVPQLFLATALLNALVAAYIYSVTPEYLNRFFAWLSGKP
ncbi:MAG TPA: MFS transporter [Rhodocyclaceae bacterium]